MKKILLPVFASMVLVACTPTLKDTANEVKQELRAGVAKEVKSDFPIRIGVLADSQITTDKGRYDYGMRRIYADKLASVAIRPVAVEYLAHLMLDRFLGKLKEQRVDMVLYLGDGANSGCKDELDVVFSSLEKFRIESHIPTYYVIGNHDYLGAGNQTKMDIRQNLCSNQLQVNPAETKENVIKRIAKFNNESAALDQNFAYKEKKSTSNGAEQEQVNDNGHFNINYVGYLSGKSTTTEKVEIMLLDTSDYRDVIFPADMPRIGGLWGMKGSMSYLDNKGSSQIGELKNFASKNTTYRLLASHYMPYDMDAFYPWDISPSLLKDALGDLLSKGENIWVTAHTHTSMPKVKKYPVGKTFSSNKGNFEGINVGSTTDFDPHVIILESYKDGNTNKIGDSSLGYSEISYFSDVEKSACEKILLELAKKEERTLSKICGKSDYFRTLGLDQSYKKSCFRESDIKVIRNNIDVFSLNASNQLGISPTDVKVCLTYAASACEGPRDSQVGYAASMCRK